MDYDDTDFQGQNLHLAGEGSDKASSVLHPYALPKFDFDEGLQGHLRFDNLVENEVFLGIPSQEDNKWLEDFPRGSSGISFSSSAAEPCSISRCTNVWSEATSSESVEMLLKSVGQEEKIPGGTTIGASDACNELGSLSEHMESHMQQEDKGQDVMDVDPSLPIEEGKDNDKQPQGTEENVRGSSCVSLLNVSSNVCGTYVSEDSLGVSRECDGENKNELGTLVNESVGKPMQKDIFSSVIPVDAVDSSCIEDTAVSIHRTSGGLELNASTEACNIPVTDNNSRLDKKCENEPSVCEIESRGNVKGKSYSDSTAQVDNVDSCWEDIVKHNHEQASDVSAETSNCLLTSRDTGNAVGADQPKEVHAVDGIPKGVASASSTQNFDNHLLFPSGDKESVGHTISTGIRTFEAPSVLSLKDGGNLQADGHFSDDTIASDHSKSSKINSLELSYNSEVHQQSAGHVSGDLALVVHGDSNLQEHYIEVRNLHTGVSASSELKMDRTADVEESSAEGKCHLKGSDQQLDGEAASNSVTSELSTVNNNVFDGHGDGSSGNFVGNNFSSTPACSSNDFPKKMHPIENSNSIDDASGNLRGEDDAIDHVCSPADAEFMEPPKVDNDKTGEPSSQGDLRTVENICLSGPESDNSVARKERGVDASSGDTNIGSLDNAPLVSDRGANEDVPGQLDRGIKSIDGNSTKNILSSSKVRFEKEGEVGGGSSLVSAQELPEKSIEESLSRVDTCTAASGPEQAGVVSCTTTGHTALGEETVDTASLSDRAVDEQAAQELSEKSVEESLPRVDTCTSVSGAEQAGVMPHTTACQEALGEETTGIASIRDHAVVTSEVGTESSHQLGGSPTPCDSTLGHDRNEELVTSNVEEAVAANKPDLTSSEVADSDQTTRPIVSNFTLLPGSEKDKKEIGWDSPCKGIPVSEITVQLIGPDVKGDDVAKDKSSLNFEVHSPALPLERSISDSKDGPSSLSIQPCKISMIEVSPSTPGVNRVANKSVTQLSQESYQTPDVKTEPGGPKKSTERKARRTTGTTTGKGNTKRGNPLKETTSPRQSGGKMCLSGTNNLVQLEDFKSHGNIERSVPVPSVLSESSLKLPDLSKSSPSSSLFQQPFTDLQQVQLRSQIFVYGSLIQGAAPDEACMVSAFGACDSERGVWEPIWRSCLERVHSRKSQAAVSENSVQPCSGIKSSDQSTQQSAVQSNLLTSSSVRLSSNGTPSPVVKSMIPLSSPLWNMSTPCAGLQPSGVPRSNLMDYHQTVSPLHPFQSTPTRSVVEHNPSWLSQASFPAPWLASPQTTAFNAGARFSILPMTEAVKSTPVKDPLAVSSGTKHASSSMVVHSPCSIVFGGTSSIPSMKQVSVSSAQNNLDPKSRKRKKVTGPVNFAQTPVVPQPRTESLSVPVGNSHVSASMVVSIPSFEFDSSPSKIVPAVTPSLAGLSRSGEQREEKALSSNDTLSEIEESRRQAEEAAAHAAATVSHSQSVWSQLDQQKSSGLLSDAEAKLASAAVIVAAAASVAKAAAAAAKIASNAAQQAKLMADEALIYSTRNLDQNAAASLSDVTNSLGKATSASILKGGDGNNSSASIIVAAREAARRRVEAASSASKHAENLNAIVKAAELAAEAVSQAGKIVSMSEPFPLNELVKAGPEGFWRTQQVSPEQVAASSDCNIEQSKIINAGDPGTSGKHVKVGPSEEAVNANSGVLPLSAEPSESIREGVGVSGSITSSDKNSRWERIGRASDLAKTIAVAKSEIVLQSPSVAPEDEYVKVGSLKEENNIKEGSVVEVRKDTDVLGAVWFTASVLNLKNGKVLVGYMDLQSEGGSGRLEEWVALEHEGDTAPRIRIARPMTTRPSEGTKKRRRSAMGDHVWSIGDRVEAWMQNCWREGVISEKKDDNTVTVKFSEEGEKSIVGVWHLRRTLVWKDGEWIEWSCSRKGGTHPQGDTPQEKRLRLNVATMEGRSKENISKNVQMADRQKPQESRLLALSTNEKEFNIGKNSVDENKLDAQRTVRSGLQKEGPRVIFGVPKPGKKRKYMDVSKHYVTDKSDNGDEPMKLAKYLMPQGQSSHSWKNYKGDAKDKQLAELKTKVPKTGKPPSTPGRTLPQKEKSSNSELSSQDEGIIRDQRIRDSIKADDKKSVQQNQVDFGSSSNTVGGTEGPILFSSRRLQSDAPTKKIPSSFPKSERSNRGKPAFSTGKFARVEVKDKHNNVNQGKSIPEVAEPRRSNRKIQPTSRLLEGLQSSLSISKIPTFSQDKSHKSLNRGTPKGNKHG